MPRTEAERRARGNKRARLSVQAVRMLHTSIPCGDEFICKECGEEYPCMTIHVIEEARRRA